MKLFLSTVFFPLLFLIWSNACFGAVIISNNILSVGISDSGALNAMGTGIRHAQYAGADYIFPGEPFHYFSLGINGVYASNIASYDVNIPATTTGSTTTGYFGDLRFVQTVTLGGGSIYFSVSLQNIGLFDLANVAFATGFDPDQDANLYDEYETINAISSGAVTATGPVSGASISILGDGRGSISSGWDTNPYVLHDDGDGDHAISMSWIFEQIARGETRDISFAYAVTPAAVPIPAAAVLMGTGLLGVFGLMRVRGKKGWADGKSAS